MEIQNSIKEEIPYKLQDEILDEIGKQIIPFRDKLLYNVVNNILSDTSKEVKYNDLNLVNDKVKNLLIDFVEEVIDATIFNYLNMFDANDDWLKFKVKYKEHEYNVCELSELMGSEMSNPCEDGWIYRFSTFNKERNK